MLDAAARFLEARPRSDRRGPAPADVRLGYRRRAGRRGDRAPDRARLSRRRGVRAGLGRVARPRPAARRARAAARAAASRASTARSIDDVLGERRAAAQADPRRRRRPRRWPRTRGGRRLLERHAPGARPGDGPARRRRQRAYAILARNGFDPSTAERQAARGVVADTATTDARTGCPIAGCGVGYGDNRMRTRGPPPGEPWHRMRSGGAFRQAFPVPSPSDLPVPRRPNLIRQTPPAASSVGWEEPKMELVVAVAAVVAAVVGVAVGFVARGMWSPRPSSPPRTRPPGSSPRPGPSRRT